MIPANPTNVPVTTKTLLDGLYYLEVEITFPYQEEEGSKPLNGRTIKEKLFNVQSNSQGTVLMILK